jgi:hypothetical protein
MILSEEGCRLYSESASTFAPIAQFPRSRDLVSGPALYDRSVLCCVECRREATGKGLGWRAILGLEDDDTETVVVLCPDCAYREFGDERERRAAA